GALAESAPRAVMPVRDSGATMSRRLVRKSAASALAIGLACGAAACGNGTSSAAEGPAMPAAVKLAPENVTRARLGEISAGPAISGELTAAREATMRAQVGGSLVALPLDRGQPVRHGAVVARISSRDL